MKLDLANPAWRQTLPPARSIAADAPVAACAFSRDGATVAFALGDGSVRLLPADIAAAAPDAADARCMAARCWRWSAIRRATAS